MTCPDPSCAAVGANCGVLTNSCGLDVDCGTCQVMGETCGGGGVQNQCGSPSMCGDGILSGSEECDDGNQNSGDGCSATCTVEPAYMDPCDGLDNDGDGEVDEGHVPTTCGVTGGDCVAGMTACVAGSVTCVGEVGPTAEVCDGRDNDCDAIIDENASPTCSTPNATAACVFGLCMIGNCNAGWGDCDGDSVNGCEADLASSLNHCGSCGTECPMPLMCISGECQP